MSAPISSDTRAKLEAWLRYFDDIGLGAFYRDRIAAAPMSAVSSPPAPKQESTARAEVPAQPAPLARPAPVPRVPETAMAKIPALPIVQGPSLFEAVDRVENDSLERIREDIGDCTRCRLHKQRNHIVFGVGNAKAELVFVGEGPGHDEDVQGIPFVGRAGQLLTQMIDAMGLRREDVYICNVIKCRPPENRTPEKDEIATCSPFLLRQLAVIAPKVIVCLGNIAAQTLLGTHQSISQYRGQWVEFRGSRLLATYHPAYLLRNPNAKGEVWKDLQKVMAVLGLSPRKR